MDYWGDPGDAVVELPEAPSTRALVDRSYGAEFGGYVGQELEVHEAPVAWSETANGATSDGWWPEPTMDVWPDYAEGGVPATSTALPYSWKGPVEPSNVENFELTGRLLVPGRDAEHAPGPVGATEYRDMLIMQIVQQMGPEVTAEMAAVGLLSGV
jgi:hypothetical protein